MSISLRIALASAARLAVMLATAATLIASAPSATAQSIGPATGDVLPARSYYIVTRVDLRMCPSPLCGGVYVKLVNRRLTLCADGTFAEDCYAPILDWSALALSAEDQIAVEGDFRTGRVLVRGDLRIVDSPFGPLAGLVASDAWRGVTGNRPTRLFYGLRPSGIVCIASPCPSLLAVYLNHVHRSLIHDLDLAASGADATQIQTGLDALHQGAGLIVSGRLRPVSGPAGRGIGFVASEFFTRVGSSGGDACSATDPLPPRPDACVTLWDPVCGCDGVTYGNECMLQQAGGRLAYRGTCKSR